MTLRGGIYARSARRALWATFASSAALGAFCLPSQAMAQAAPAPVAESGLQEIVVTAQKREQRLQDVPVAVTALNQESIAANRIVSVRDLNAVVPNLTVRSGVGGSNTPFYTLRGAYAGTSAIGADRGIAYYIDDVYIAATNGGFADQTDIAQIEVLRGPQGTLFGRNATGGAISIHTAEPTRTFGVRQGFTVGNYDQFRSETRINTGEIGPFSASVSYVHSQRRGDIRNLRPGVVWDYTRAFGYPQTFTSAKWLGDNNNEGVRAAIRFEPAPNLKFLYRFDWYTSDFTSDGVGLTFANTAISSLRATQDPATLTPFSLTRPDAVNNGNTVPSHLEGWGHVLTTTFEAASNLSFKNVFAVRRSEGSTPLVDISGVGYMINTGTGPWIDAANTWIPMLGAAAGPPRATIAAANPGAPFIVQSTVISGTDKQISDEFQVNYRSSLVTATAGAIYFQNRQTRQGQGNPVDLGLARSGGFLFYPGFNVPFTGQGTGRGGRPSFILSKSYAVFGQAEIHVTPELDLIGGIRYTKEKKSGTDRTVYSAASPLTFYPTFDDSQITYSVGANYKPNRDILIYAKYATGYIAGGNISNIPYGAETSKSVEGGIKADWFNHVLRTNLAVFHVDYKNVQLSGNGTLIGRPEVTNFLISAGDARANGFELETQLAPARGLTFSAGLGFTDFKFTRLDPNVTAGKAFFYPTNRPRWTLNLSGQYQTEPLFEDVRMTLRADGSYRSKMYMNADVPAVTATFTQALQDAFQAAIVTPAAWVVNARASLDGFNVLGSKANFALWARNLFDNKAPTTMQSLVNVVSAQYERARTFGADVTVEF